MTVDLTQIIVALIGVVISAATAVITKVIVPWIKARTSQTTQSVIEAAATAAVYAAQQLYTSDEWSEKKDYAMQYVTNALEAYGAEAHTYVISAAIESALKAIKISAGDAWE